MEGSAEASYGGAPPETVAWVCPRPWCAQEHVEATKPTYCSRCLSRERTEKAQGLAALTWRLPVASPVGSALTFNHIGRTVKFEQGKLTVKGDRHRLQEQYDVVSGTPCEGTLDSLYYDDASRLVAKVYTSTGEVVQDAPQLNIVTTRRAGKRKRSVAHDPQGLQNNGTATTEMRRLLGDARRPDDILYVWIPAARTLAAPPAAPLAAPTYLVAKKDDNSPPLQLTGPIGTVTGLVSRISRGRTWPQPYAVAYDPPDSDTSVEVSDGLLAVLDTKLGIEHRLVVTPAKRPVDAGGASSSKQQRRDFFSWLVNSDSEAEAEEDAEAEVEEDADGFMDSTNPFAWSNVEAMSNPLMQEDEVDDPSALTDVEPMSNGNPLSWTEERAESPGSDYYLVEEEDDEADEDEEEEEDDEQVAGEVDEYLEANPALLPYRAYIRPDLADKFGLPAELRFLVWPESLYETSNRYGITIRADSDFDLQKEANIYMNELALIATGIKERMKHPQFVKHAIGGWLDGGGRGGGRKEAEQRERAAAEKDAERVRKAAEKARKAAEAQAARAEELSQRRAREQGEKQRRAVEKAEAKRVAAEARQEAQRVARETKKAAPAARKEARPAMRAEEERRYDELAWNRKKQGKPRPPDGPVRLPGAPTNIPKAERANWMLKLDHLQEPVRDWFAEFIEFLYQAEEKRYTHVYPYKARSGAKGEFDGFQLSLNHTYMGRAWERELGALLMAAVTLDPRLNFRLSLNSWILWLYEDEAGSRFAQWKSEVAEAAQMWRDAEAAGASFGPPEADGRPSEPGAPLPRELLEPPGAPPLPGFLGSAEDEDQVNALALYLALDSYTNIDMHGAVDLLEQGDAAVVQALREHLPDEEVARVMSGMGRSARQLLGLGLSPDALSHHYAPNELLEAVERGEAREAMRARLREIGVLPYDE